MRRATVMRWSALLPACLLSTWWTVSLVDDAEPGAVTSAPPSGLPVSDTPYDGAASWSVPRRTGLGVPRGAGDGVVAAASVHGIPTSALAAYHRAETVINAADRSCGLPWELVAAIGRVESDHGRYGGNTLGTDGVSRPGVYGVPLDGRHGTREIGDTDAGQWDRDVVHDRAVGPMQFIPSTWSDVGVDADGDGWRNPQDVDDAALAAAVYLCGGTDDLSGEAGQRAAVFRYNHSRAYVDTVLSVMEAYLAGEYAAAPDYVTSAVTFTPASGSTRPIRAKQQQHAHAPAGHAPGGFGQPSVASASPVPPAAPAPAPEPHGDGHDDPVRTIAKTVATTTETVSRTVREVATLLSPVEAALRCATEGHSALLDLAAFDQCVYDHTH